MTRHDTVDIVISKCPKWQRAPKAIQGSSEAHRAFTLRWPARTTGSGGSLGTENWSRSQSGIPAAAKGSSWRTAWDLATKFNKFWKFSEISYPDISSMTKQVSSEWLHHHHHSQIVRASNSSCSRPWNDRTQGVSRSSNITLFEIHVHLFNVTWGQGRGTKASRAGVGW